MKILILGSNPSTNSPDNSAFHPDTSSGQMVRKWIAEFPDVDFGFANVYDYYIDQQHAATKRRMKATVPDLLYKIEGYDGIIALGKIADEAVSLTKTSIKVLRLPHPSGCNRCWNDRGTHDDRREKMQRFIRSLELDYEPLDELYY